MVTPKVVRIGFVKLGNIGSAPLIEFLLDERAERQLIKVKVVGSGAKMTREDASEAAEDIASFKPDLALVVSPNASLPGPSEARKILKQSGTPTIVVSDGPAKKVVKQLEEDGFGYLIVEADSMIGARREFLDPVEMSLFNADLIRVLSITGAFNVLCSAIDDVIGKCHQGGNLTLPRIIVDKERAVEAAGFTNEYAKAKAMAAYEIARRVADLTAEGCFVVKEWERYTRLVAAGHEMMRTAARLVDEAREIEKAEDTVTRRPHHDDGTLLFKTKLIEKPKRLEVRP
jgi:methylenetetrahydromethanopterin dehydrogenase